MNYRRLFVLLALPVLLCSSLFALPVSAAGTLINYDDYATYSVQDDGSRWNVAATFPRDWFDTRVWTANWGQEIATFKNKSTFDVSFPADGASSWCMQISPLGGLLGGHIDVGDSLPSDTKILDLSLIPDNTAFIYRFVFDYGGDVNLQVAGTASFRVACVNSQGVVTSMDFFDMTPVQNGNTITYSGTFTPNDYDVNAAGVVPFFYIVNQGVFWPQDHSPHTLSVSYDFFRLSFGIPDAVKQAQDDARSQKMLSNIGAALEEQGKTLDDILSGGAAGDDLMSGSDKLEDAGAGLGDSIGDISDFEDVYMGQLDDQLPDILASADLNYLVSPLAFVKMYTDKIVAGVPSQYLLIFTLPALFGIFFYIVGHPIRAPKPDKSGDVVTRETFTTTTVLTGKHAGQTSTVRTVTQSQEIGRVSGASDN